MFCRKPPGNVEYISEVVQMIKNRLKEIRMKEYMMSQKEFAEFLGVETGQYNRYEHNIVPTLENALKIANKLNRDVRDIFSLVEE